MDQLCGYQDDYDSGANINRSPGLCAAFKKLTDLANRDISANKFRNKPL